jgi:hypothetical protein
VQQCAPLGFFLARPEPLSGSGFAFRMSPVTTMTTQRPRPGRFANGSKREPFAAKVSARQFPVQRQIQHLEDDLHAFNERIVELEHEGHRGHAMEVLKANAIDLARKIDELRILLIEPAKKA